MIVIRVLNLFLLMLLLSSSLAQERDHSLMIAEGRLIYQLELSQLPAAACDDITLLLLEALQRASIQLFLNFPETISQLEAAERSHVTELVIELFEADSLRLSMSLPVSAPQRLPEALYRQLEQLKLKPLSCDIANESLLSREMRQVLEKFQLLAGRMVLVTEWRSALAELLASEIDSSPLLASLLEETLAVDVGITQAGQIAPAPLTLLPPLSLPTSSLPVLAADALQSGATETSVAMSTRQAEVQQAEVQQAEVQQAEVQHSAYQLPSSINSALLLPSVQERIQRAPLVLDIPDISSPAVRYPLYEPEYQPVVEELNSSAFRLNISSSTVYPTTVSADILQDAGETSEGYLHVVGYERLPAISTLRVTNFANPQLVIDRQRGYLAVIETNKGRIVAELYNNFAPITVNNFIFLTRYNFYNGVPFHRVVANFLAQTGDPSGTGEGTPGYTFADEINTNLSHNTAGVLAMANNGVDSNGSQFFISLQAMPWLDGQHSIFGQVIAGYEVLGRLQPTDVSEKIPTFYLDMTATLNEVMARGIELEDRQEFSEIFYQALEQIESGTFTTAPLSSAAVNKPLPTLGDYLHIQLGQLPSEGTSFQLAGRDVTLVVNAEGKKQLAVFAPDDYIERIYILQKLLTAN